MKVEELYTQDKDSQIGVTFQRQPYETEVDIFPEVSPLTEGGTTAGISQQSGEPVESALTSVQMEEAVCRVVKHRGEEEFQPIPLKRVDSGPTSHRLQFLLQGIEGESDSLEGKPDNKSRHEELLDEIDGVDMEVKGAKSKKEKKDGTLSRMKEKLKSLRGERGEKGEKDEDGKGATKSLSKIFHRVNPVSKASRESFSKVFHKIGDALQKKEEDKEDAKKNAMLPPELENTLKHNDQEQ